MIEKPFSANYFQHIKTVQESCIFTEDASGARNTGPVFVIALALSLLFQLFVVYFFPVTFNSGKSWLRASSPALNVDIEFISNPAIRKTQSLETVLKEHVGSPVGASTITTTSQHGRASALKPEVGNSIDVSPNSISQAAANTLPEYTQNGSEGARIVPKRRMDPGVVETIRISSNLEIVRRGDTCFSVSEPEPDQLMRGKVWSMPYFCGEPLSQKMMGNVQRDFCSRYGCDNN